MQENPKKWRLNKSHYVVNDRWLKVRENSYTTPNGQVIEPYYILEYPAWVNCFVLDCDKNVVLVRHYRPGVDEYLLEIVGGVVEASDVSPAEAIKRELKEEIGYDSGGELVQLATSYVNPGVQNNTVHSFIAYGGACSQPLQHEEGESLFPVKVSLTELKAMVKDPNVTFQSMHLTTILLALDYIEENELA